MTKTWLRLISILEIIGGVLGIPFLIWWLLNNPINIATIFLLPIPVFIYILSVAAGIALWRETPFGRTTSIIVQGIQLIKIVSPLLTFMFSFGFDFWVHFSIAAGSLNLGVEFRFLASNQLFINVQGAPVIIGISIPAWFFLVKLLRYKPPTGLNENSTPRVSNYN